MHDTNLPGWFDGPSELVATRDGYDRWSAVYDAEDNPLIALEEPRIDELIGNVSGLAVADLGCGTGRHTARLAHSGATVTALDFSESMLKVARQKPQCAAVRFIVHDLNLPLPVPDRSFDRVICGLVLEHLRDVPMFFREMRRICRDNGIAVISVMHPAMWLAGVQARFTDSASGKKILVESQRHTISEYVMSALRAGWRIDHLSEHAVNEALARRMPKVQKYLGWPMLVMMRVTPSPGCYQPGLCSHEESRHDPRCRRG